MSKTYKNMNEAVRDIFFSKVLGVPAPKQIKKSQVIGDFCKNKAFSAEYVDMVVDRTERELSVSIRKIKNKPLMEILDFIEKKKMLHSRYGNKF